MQHPERNHKSSDLAGTEQVFLRRGAPAEISLGSEERFDHEEAACNNELADLRQPRPVKIIEHQNRIKRAQVGPRPREVDHAPVDDEAFPTGVLSRYGEAGLVVVHTHHRRTRRCRGETVSPFSAGQIEHPGSGPQPMSVPEEPGAGPGEPRGGRNGHGRSSERATLAEIAAEPAELLVIGGGITGAGIARDAAMRGLHTVLVEQGDLGSGTSSRSSRLIHGGLRYLETGTVGLVLEANRERRILLHIAPHLV